MGNENIHKAVLDALGKVKAVANGQDAAAVRHYNKERKEVTAAFGVAMIPVWEALERGESVGGCVGKEQYCTAWNMGIRWVQKAVTRALHPDAKPMKANCVRLAASMMDNIQWDSGSKRLIAWVDVDQFEEEGVDLHGCGIHGSLVVRIPCKSEERREKIAELETKVFAIVKQLHLMPKEFKAEWEEWKACWFAKLPKFLQPKQPKSALNNVATKKEKKVVIHAAPIAICEEGAKQL